MGPLPSLSAGEEQGLAALQARWRGFNTRRRLGKGHTKRYAPALPSLRRLKTPQICLLSLPPVLFFLPACRTPAPSKRLSRLHPSPCLPRFPDLPGL